LQATLDGTLPLTRRTNLAISAQQLLSNTAGEVEDVGVVLSQLATLTLNHAVSRNLLAALSVGYTRNEVVAESGTPGTTSGENFDYWYAGARFSYALTRILSLSAGYRYQSRHIRDDRGMATQFGFGSDYDENRVWIALSADFPIF
jgi:uncharacterized protein (PEP-CTERM system associated)